MLISGNVKALGGNRKSFEGKAFIKNLNCGRFDVEFMKPFKSEFVIMDIANDYKSLLMGTDDRKYAWVLSRDMNISDNLRKDYLKKLDVNKFDIDKFVFY